MPALRVKSERVYAMSMMSLYSGLRFAEVAGLKWKDLNFETGKISVMGKGGKPRTVPLHPILEEMLLEMQKNYTKNTDIIFSDYRGNVTGKLSRTFWIVLKELGLNKGIEEKRDKLDFHSFRHTYATRLAELGTPLTVLRDLLGHADLQMVSRYAHVMPGSADEAVRRLRRPTQKVIQMKQ